MIKISLFIPFVLLNSLWASDFQLIDPAKGKDRLIDVVSFDDRFILLGNHYTYHSENGREWKKKKLSGIKEPLRLETLYIHKNDPVRTEGWGLVVTCKNGDLYSSMDGIKWSLYHKGNGFPVKKVYEAEFSPWTYMMLGDSGQVYTCDIDEGYTGGWNYSWLGTHARLNDAAFIKGRWLVVGNDGTALKLYPDTVYSTDPVMNNQKVHARHMRFNDHINFNSIAEYEDYYITVGDSGYLQFGNRDDAYTVYHLGPHADLKAVAVNKNGLVAIDSVRAYWSDKIGWRQVNTCMGARMDADGKAELLGTLRPLREDEGTLRDGDRQPITVDFDGITRSEIPDLPGSGWCLEDFVPPGWEILCADTGKLDRNNTDDVVFVIENRTPLIAETDDYSPDTFFTYSRILGVLCGYTQNNKPVYHLEVRNAGAVPIRESRFVEEPFGGLEIKDRTIVLNTGFFANAGTWYMSGSTFIFRYGVQNSELGFHLVSVETNTYKRNTGENWDVSINPQQRTMRVEYTAPEQDSDAGQEDFPADTTYTREIPEEELPPTLLKKFNPGSWSGMGT